MSFITIGLISLCVIIVMMSPRSATGLLFLFPAYGLYLFFDNKLLNLWRVKIIDALKAMAIDLDAIRQALIANKTLPSETLQGMLDTLPEAGDLVSEQSDSASTRNALAVIVNARDDNLNYNLLYR